MTGLLQEREFSRKTFLKGGGALVVGFSLLGAARAGGAHAAESPFASNGPYDPNQIDSWIVINPDNTASVKLGKVELGQGSMTGLLMVAAEELDLDMSQMRPIANDTELTPNQGITAGSSSIRSGGKQTRAAAAAARKALLALAATRLGADAGTLSVNSGVVTAPGGKSVKYGDLLGGKLFNIQMPPTYRLTAQAAPLPNPEAGPVVPNAASAGPGLAPGFPGLTKPVSEYKLVGVAPGPPRVDIPAKVTGSYTYVQNIRLPGMLHGRVVRARGQGAYPDGISAPVAVDERSIAHIHGARVVRKGNFLGVIAPREYDAIQAAAQLKVKWAAPPPLPGVGNLFKHMREQDSAGLVPATRNLNLGNVDAALGSAAKTVQQTYSYHYNGHLPIGPSCAVADVTPQGVRVFSNTQNAYATRTAIAQLLSVAPNLVRISYVEGSSVFGSSPYDDTAQAAALMSQLVGKPVRVQLMRWDEHGYDNYGPAQLMDIRGGIDANGTIVASDYTGFQIPYFTTTPTQELAGLPVQVSTTQSADTSNTGTQYSIANRRVTTKLLPLKDNYFKTTYLRAPLAPQSLFGYEQMVDELAHAANMDPVAFRLHNITSNAVEAQRGLPATWDRWKNVLEAVTKLAKWQPKVAAAKIGSGTVLSGRGIALGGFAGTMAGIVADIQVNRKTGKITVNHMYGAQDTGLTVYPGGIENQAVGSITQGVSRALSEEVTFDKGRVTSLDWVGYPILRFKDAPLVDFTYVQRTDIPDVPTSTVAASGVLATGSGEPPTAPVAAAIANAFFDATGVRIREAPMTPARVRAVLKAAA